MFCAYTWSRYQVSVYRTIGPLVKREVAQTANHLNKLELKLYKHDIYTGHLVNQFLIPQALICKIYIISMLKNTWSLVSNCYGYI